MIKNSASVQYTSSASVSVSLEIRNTLLAGKKEDFAVWKKIMRRHCSLKKENIAGCSVLDLAIVKLVGSIVDS